MSKKVILVGAAADRYGADAMLAYFASHLAEHHTVDVVLPEDGPLREVLSARGIDSAVVDTIVVRKSLKRPGEFGRAMLLLLPRLFDAWRRIGRSVDLVYVNTVTVPIWVMAAWLRRRSVVVHVHEIVGGRTRAARLARRILYSPLLGASAVVCVSEAVRRDVLAAYPGLEQKVVTILNANFVPPVVTSKDSRPERPYDFVVVGRLSPRKGQHLVLNAMKLMEEPPRVALAGTPFRGYEWYEEDLRRDIVRHQLPVDLLGYQPSSAAMEMAGAVIVPSTVPDPAPLVVIEALSHGRVCIAAETGGIPELLGDVGFSFPAEDASLLAEEMSKVRALSPQTRAEAESAALRRAEELDPKHYWTKVDALLGAMRG
jgi:glycosyltransferase involved in cell wall biosynthesis